MEFGVRKKFWNPYCKKTSGQISVRIFQPEELIYIYVICKILKKIGQAVLE